MCSDESGTTTQVGSTMFSSQLDSFSSSSKFTSSQNTAGGSSTTCFKFRDGSNTMPLTVKQIFDAHELGSGQRGAPFVVDDVEFANIRLVGMIKEKIGRMTYVSFTLDDGTGRLDFIKWVNDPSDCAKNDAFKNGMYVVVVGTLNGISKRKRATAFSVRPVIDFNEVTLHFIQCVRMHIKNTKSKVVNLAQNNYVVRSLYHNDVCEASTPSSVKSKPVGNFTQSNYVAGSSFYTGASEAKTPLCEKSKPATLTISKDDLNKQVLNIFREPASIEKEHGLHIDEITKRLGLTTGNIKEAIYYHVNAGHIYSTIDDFHFKSGFDD